MQLAEAFLISRLASRSDKHSSNACQQECGGFRNDGYPVDDASGAVEGGKFDGVVSGRGHGKYGGLRDPGTLDGKRESIVVDRSAAGGRADLKPYATGELEAGKAGLQETHGVGGAGEQRTGDVLGKCGFTDALSQIDELIAIGSGEEVGVAVVFQRNSDDGRIDPPSSTEGAAGGILYSGARCSGNDWSLEIPVNDDRCTQVLDGAKRQCNGEQGGGSEWCFNHGLIAGVKVAAVSEFLLVDVNAQPVTPPTTARRVFCDSVANEFSKPSQSERGVDGPGAGRHGAAMSTLAEIEAAAETLSAQEKEELFLFLATRLPAPEAEPEPRKFSKEQMAAWIAEDEEDMRQLREEA